MDVRKLIDFNRARLDFLASQEQQKDLRDPNLFDLGNQLYENL